MSYRMVVTSKDADKGFTLIAPFGQNKMYLVDYNGGVVHTWQSDRKTQGTVELLEDGTLLRGRTGTSGQPDGIHLLDWDGTVLWDYQPPADFKWHHDIEPLPNGNILINAMQSYTYDQVVGWGRDPSITQATLYSGPIVEIRPNGTTGGDIVWMFHPLDHMIPEYAPQKPSFGVIKDHPELVDFNFPPQSVSDWQHSNAVSYNAELDQVMITNRNFDEIWVVDHGTTTAEAAGHTGGTYGRGGDLLYRWGNPRAYDAGDATDQILYGPHDAHWIGPGLPGEGNIIIFNNGMNALMQVRPEGKISTVEELVPPLNATGGYELYPGPAYGPSDPVWRYNASPPENFFAWSMGGVERLPDGNTLVCGGSAGSTFEVNPKNEVVWEYTSLGPFKASRYYPPAIRLDHDLNATEDVMLRVNVSSYLSDPDTDTEDLAIGANSFYAIVAGHELLLLYTDEIMTDVIQVTVSDGIFMVGRDVRVNITLVNDPPELMPIPAIKAIEAVPYVLDLGPYISDPDNDIHQMSITVDSSYVTVEGGKLRFLYPDGVLTDRFLLSVSDGEHEDHVVVLVTVRPVNDPPTVDRIPDQQGMEDVPWTIDLGTRIRDVDSPLENISVTSGSPYTSVSGLTLTLLYPDGVTRDVVTLAVSDGQDETVVSFDVTIEPVNDPPVIGDVLPVTITEDELFTLDIGPAILDIDTPREGLTLTVDSPFVEVEGHNLSLLYPDGPFHDEVVIELWDGDLRASTTLVVDVEPVNDPPEFADIPPLTVKEDEPFSLDLGPAILDVDTPTEELTIEVDSPFITVEGHNLSLLYPDGVLHDEVVIELWDGELHASTTLVVTVEPVNDPPWWAQLPDIVAVEDVEGQLDLGPFMGDTDTPLAQLAIEVASSYGWLDGRVLRFLYPNGVHGETVTLTLTDGEFQAVVRLNVTVTPVNDAPELSGASVDPPEGGAGTTFRFTVVLRDVDIGSGVPVVEVVIDDVGHVCTRDELSTGPYSEGVAFLFETDLGPGTHTFSFTADDGDGGAVTSETLSVSVKGTAGNTALPTILVLALIIGSVALAAVLLIRKRGSSESSL